MVQCERARDGVSFTIVTPRRSVYVTARMTPAAWNILTADPDGERSE